MTFFNYNKHVKAVHTLFDDLNHSLLLTLALVNVTAQKKFKMPCKKLKYLDYNILCYSLSLKQLENIHTILLIMLFEIFIKG